jgi:hypothetical protein
MLIWTVAEKPAPKVHVSVGDIAVDKMAILKFVITFQPPLRFIFFPCAARVKITEI